MRSSAKPQRLAAPGSASTACPLCSEPTTVERVIRGYVLRRCHSCGHRHFSVAATSQHVDEVYDDGYFFGGGAGYPDYTASRDSLEAQGRYYGRLLKRFSTPGSLIDVGAAAGFLTSGFRQEGWDATGVEPNQRMAQYAREQVGVDVRVASVESYAPAEKVRAVALVQVIAHLRDPLASLKRVRSWLAPGGVLLVETWDSQSLTARCLGARWHELSPPSVLHLFSRKTLERALLSSGFRVERMGLRIKSIRIGHAAELLRHSQGGNSAMAWLCERLPQDVALPYPGDDLFWCVARKAEPLG